MCKEKSSHDAIAHMVVKDVRVRLIVRDERIVWDELIRRHHYLGLVSLVGKSLRYVAEYEGEWVALLGWQSAALKVDVRDTWIGWRHEEQYQRLHLIANNSRFVILPGWQMANLASRILSLTIKRLSADWQRIHGHPILVAETFVDRDRFHGTCYRAANWKVVGQTSGWSRSGRRYWHHGQVKDVLVYPLHRRAREWLNTPGTDHIHPSWRCAMSRMSWSSMTSLHEVIKSLPDCRSRRGRRHRLATILTISVGALLGGARGYTAIAEWASRLTQNQLKRLNCWRNSQTGKYNPPSERTIRRVLQQIDATLVDRAVGEWFLSQAADDAIAIDGKTMKGARDRDGRQVHLLSAFLQQEGVTIAQIAVGEKTNEIPEMKRLLDPLPLEGRVISADALHTQVDTARYLVEEKKADYIFTVKMNQPGLRDEIAIIDDRHFFSGSRNRRKRSRSS